MWKKSDKSHQERMDVAAQVLHESVKFFVMFMIITFVPGLPPHMQFESYSITPPKPLVGVLGVNEQLNNAKKLFLNKIKGPEHLEVHDGALYTSLEGGFVVQIVEDRVLPVVKFGNKCDGLYDPQICGRPLGLTFDHEGFMYVADAYYGVFKVNISTGKYDQLVSMNTEINGKRPKSPNSLAVASDGTVYWSDISMTHTEEDALYLFLGNANGRLIKYRPATKENTVLIDNVHFANGVALSEDESFVLVCDLGRSRILRYNLKGPTKGETEVFLDGLPGYPDNMHSDKEGGFYVTLIGHRRAPSFTRLMGPLPTVRQMFARCLYLLEFPAILINKLLPNYFTKLFTHWVGNPAMIPHFITNHPIVIFFDEDGRITKSLHATDGRLSMITDFAVFNNTYYLGSYSNKYLAAVKHDFQQLQ